MRDLIGKVIRWLVHEHEWEIMFRQITRYQTPKGKGWNDENWTKLIWYQKCKTCRQERTKTMTSGLHAPKH